VEHLTPAQVDQLRQALKGELSRLEARLRSVQGEAASAGEEVERQDAAAQEMRRLNAVAKSERAGGRAVEVRAALGRMRDGSYGVCEESDEDIPFARLAAEPTTRYTVEALEQLGLDAGAQRASGDEEREAY
jgi:DnaK suppressor protein